MKQYKIIFLIPYFGKFPEWEHLYFETVKQNKNIDFYFFTDCDIEKHEAKNIFYQKMSFQEYINFANSKISINFNPKNAYKLCDLRPLYPIIHEDIIKEYDFYGWTDLDLLLGDIRSFYTDDLLSKYEVFSTHAIRIAGHMALFKNTYKNKNIYKNIYRWQEALENPEFVGIDEHGITNAYTLTVFDKINQKFNLNINNFVTRFLSKRKKRKLYMVEQYTTPFTTIPWTDGSINSQQPDTWYYKNGQVTNNRDGDRKFIYIHFMNFKSDTWRHDNTPAPWKNKKQICFAKTEDMKTGIVIDNNGINKMIHA